MDTTTLLAGVAVAAVAAYFFVPSFGQLVRTVWRSITGAFVSDLAKQKDEYERLSNLLPLQTKAAADVMARAKQAKEDWDAAEQAVTAAEAKFNRHADSASVEEKRKLASNYTEAQKTAAAKKAIAENLAQEADDAVNEIDDTTKALEGFATQISNDEAKVSLAAAKRTATQVRNATKSLRSAISAAGSASRNIDLDLKRAEAESELSKGSKLDRDLAKKEADMDADAAIAALEAKRNGGADKK